MPGLLTFLQTYQTLIYLFLAAAFLLYALRGWRAWRRLQDAIFGLEREHAEERLRRSVWGMGLTFFLLLAVFAAATYIAPFHSAVVLPTPTISLSGTPGVDTLSPAAGLPLETPTPIPPPKMNTEGCVPGKIEITQPQSGHTISGEVDIEGSAILPDFGFYKVDIAPQEQALFLTIFASHTPVKNGALVEKWDTAAIPPGDYVLQLVVVDNQGKSLPPCRVRIHIAPPNS